MGIKKTLAAIACALTTSGCLTQTVTMYPVQGPLSKQVPLPVITASADGITGNTGNISLRLPDGESCNGRWSSVAPQYAGSASGSLMTLYGNTAGFSVTSSGIVPGRNRGEAFVACDRGTSIQIEFYTGSGTANGYGVAKDSRQNIYKLIF